MPQKITTEKTEAYYRLVRLIDLLYEKGYSTDDSLAYFEREIGMGGGWVKNFTSKKFRETSLRCIKLRYPMVNIEWLKNGVGEPLIETPTANGKANTEIVNDKNVSISGNDNAVNTGHEQILSDDGKVTELKNKCALLTEQIEFYKAEVQSLRAQNEQLLNTLLNNK